MAEEQVSIIVIRKIQFRFLYVLSKYLVFKIHTYVGTRHPLISEAIDTIDFHQSLSWQNTSTTSTFIKTQHHASVFGAPDVAFIQRIINFNVRSSTQQASTDTATHFASYNFSFLDLSINKIRNEGLDGFSHQHQAIHHQRSPKMTSGEIPYRISTERELQTRHQTYGVME